jgi:Uma2 family endonuclease
MTAQDYLDARSKHRLTVEEFLLLDREGAFGDRRTELFEGEVYYMSPKHRPHARAVTELVVALAKALEGSELSVLSDISVRLSDHDVPEPDIAVTDAPEGDGILPLESVKLLIEVADSTLAQDMGLKAVLYAGAGVPEYWVVDVNGRVIHQMWSPGPDGYAERRDVAFGERIEAATIDGLTVDTASL